MKKISLIIQSILIFVVLISLVSCKSSSIPESELDVFMNAFQKHSPKPYSGTLLVYQSGETIYQQSFGYADIENNIKITNDHLFPVGSITKMITATGIMLLQEQGLLNIDDSINDYFDDEFFDPSLKIRHLLSHATEFNRDSLFKGLSDVSTQEHLSHLTTVNKNKKATDSFKYSNANYILLAIIIERVTNKPYAQFIDDEIFKPLNMNHSYVGMDEKTLTNQVLGYRISNPQPSKLTMYNLSNVIGSGNIIMSSNDLLNFVLSLKNETLLSAQSIQQMMSPQICDGVECYGFGWFMSSNLDNRFYHGGHINNSGYISYLQFDRNNDTITILLTNNEDSTAFNVVRQSINALLNDQPTIILRSENKKSLTNEEIGNIIGVYSINNVVNIEVKHENSVFYATAEDGKFYELIMLSKNEFAYKELPWITITFEEGKCIIQNISSVFEAISID